MVTTAELQRRGLRYAVSVTAAETVANLAALNRQGLPYAVEVADGATMASRAALEARGLRYFVPVAVGVAEASKASLDRQGLRYAVSVDADILPADRRTLEQQGLAYLVKVDSSGNSIATAAGGALLLVDEANGFATDFTHAVDAERVAVKVSNATTYSTVDGFYTNAGTSPKMVYDVAGTLVWSPHNYARQSQSFDNATYWTVENGTVTANAIAAPDGTLTADKFVENNVNGPHDLQQGGVAATTGQVSVYAKAAGRTRIMLYDPVASLGYGFDLTTGTMFVVSGIPPVVGTIQDAGNGWWRCVLPCTNTTGVSVYMCNGTAYTYAGDSLSGVYLWGAQINKGSTATAYLPTTTAARYGLALDYDPVTHAARGLLCEPAATNLVTRSGEFDAWSPVNVTVVANQAVAPDGTTTMDKIYPTTSGSNRWISNAVTTAAVTYMYSVYAKAAGKRWIYFLKFDGSAGGAWFDLQTGVASNVAAGYTASIQDVGNGIYRCMVSATGNASLNDAIGISDASGSLSVTTSSTDGVYLWGAQLEAGTVATSPIPTLGATVTRAADAVYVAPASINYSTTAGSWRVEATINEFIANARLIGLQTGTAPIFQNSLTSFGLWDGPAFFSKTVASVIGSHKVACALQNASWAITADGLAVATSAAAGAMSSAGTRIGFGTDSTAVLGGSWMNGYIRKVVYVPRRKTNPELVAEST